MFVHHRSRGLTQPHCRVDFCNGPLLRCIDRSHRVIPNPFSLRFRPPVRHHSTHLTYNQLVQPNTMNPTTWLAMASVFGLLEFLVQLVVVKIRPYEPIGDELEYIERGQSPNPYRFHLFHRLPGLPTFARLSAGTGHPVAALRLLSVALSVFAMAATAGAATRVGGPVIAAGLCLILLIVPERVALASRLWPDVHLAAITSGIALVISLTPSPIEHTTSSILTGMLVAFAVLIRLDALVLIPAATIAWFGYNGWSTSNHLIFLVGPPVVAFLGWWVISKVFLGESWPDTTWKLNLGIAVQDALAQTQGDTIIIDDLVERTLTSAAVNPGDGNSRQGAPWTSHGRSALSRLRAMTGPDAFVSGKLFPGDDHERDSLSDRFTTSLFRLSFPLLLTMAMVVSAIKPTAAGWLALPSIALLLPAIFFHARTRYRLPMLLGLIPTISGSLTALISGQHSAFSWILGCAAVSILTAILARKPLRLERP